MYIRAYSHLLYGLIALLFRRPYCHTGCIEQAPCNLVYNLGSMIDSCRWLLRRIPPAASQKTGQPVLGPVSYQPSWIARSTLGEGPGVRLRLYDVVRALALGLDAPKTQLDALSSRDITTSPVALFSCSAFLHTERSSFVALTGHPADRSGTTSWRRSANLHHYSLFEIQE